MEKDAETEISVDSETSSEDTDSESESDSSSDESDFGESGKKNKRKTIVDFDVHCSCQRKFSEVADLASGSDEQCKDVNGWLDCKIDELVVKQKEVQKARMVEAKKAAPPIDVKDPSTKKRPRRPRSTRLKVKRSKKKRSKKKSSARKNQARVLTLSYWFLIKITLAPCTHINNPGGMHTPYPGGPSLNHLHGQYMSSPHVSYMGSIAPYGSNYVPYIDHPVVPYTAHT
ncbi:hypothetical protein MKX03_030499, partial [Papaver bracteatum]